MAVEGGALVLIVGLVLVGLYLRQTLLSLQHRVHFSYQFIVPLYVRAVGEIDGAAGLKAKKSKREIRSCRAEWWL